MFQYSKHPCRKRLFPATAEKARRIGTDFYCRVHTTPNKDSTRSIPCTRANRRRSHKAADYSRPSAPPIDLSILCIEFWTCSRRHSLQNTPSMPTIDRIYRSPKHCKTSLERNRLVRMSAFSACTAFRRYSCCCMWTTATSSNKRRCY